MRQIYLTFVIAIMMGMLSGCANTTTSSDVVNIGDLNGSSLPPITPIYFNESNTGNVNQSSDKNAEITIPNSMEYAICTAEFVECDPEKVKTMLFGDVSITPERIGKDDAPGYSWEKDGMYLIVHPIGVNVEFTGDLAELIKSVFLRPNNRQNGNIDLFEHMNEQLDFCTPEEATQTVNEKLLEIGVHVGKKADVYALHQNDLQNIVDQECAKGFFYDPHSTFGGYEPKPLESYEVKKSDECYYIVFHEEYTGIPIYNDLVSYKTIKDLTVFHPEIYAVYSAGGLVGLQISNYRENITQDEKITQIITSEAASESVAAKYRDVVGIERITFDTIELEYVIQPNYVDGKTNLAKARMSPAWVCTITVDRYETNKETGVEELVPQKVTVLIDALTGLEII